MRSIFHDLCGPSTAQSYDKGTKSDKQQTEITFENRYDTLHSLNLHDSVSSSEDISVDEPTKLGNDGGTGPEEDVDERFSKTKKDANESFSLRDDDLAVNYELYYALTVWRSLLGVSSMLTSK